MDGGLSVPSRRWATSLILGSLVLVGAVLALWIASGGLCSLLRCATGDKLSEAAPKVIYVPGSDALPASSLPVVVADAAHHDRGRGSQPDVYDIPAGDGVVLDARGLPLLIPAGMQLTGPNAVFVSVRGNAYQVDWEPGRAVYILSPETLEPWAENAPPFGGLKNGQALTIAVGYWDEAGEQTGDEQFIAMWQATGVVR